MRATYKQYVLVLLMVILAFNYLDRVALGILLQDIKTDLGLSDTQLGLLSGIAFALFYSVMGVPIARWADRGNRVAIIALTALLWSMAVASCGVAASFAQLLLIRIWVAVGEAGCVPPALSLIADYFNRAERPRAAAVYGLGGSMSGVIGYFLAGWLNELYGWRMTFVLLATPGLLLAALAWFTLKEPRAIQQTERTGSTTIAPSLHEVWLTLSANTTFRHLLLCLAVNYFFAYGIGNWIPAFFIRSYGLSSGEIGTWLAGVCGVAGLVGAYLGGELASRYAARNERLQLMAMAVVIACAAVPMGLAYYTGNAYGAFALIALSTAGLTTINGPLIATVQTLVPERMRAMAFALTYLVANLIGMGFGPLAAGAISDALQPWAGAESLRYALLLLTPGFLWVAWHAWHASQTVTRDLHQAHGTSSDSKSCQSAVKRLRSGPTAI